MSEILSVNPGAGVQNPGAASPAPAQPGVASDSWMASFNPELKGYVQNKGFKDPAAIVESYRNFEKLHGVPAERLVKLPEKSDDPSWQEIYNRMGRPSKAEEYSLPVSDKESDQEFAGWAKSAFYELGLSSQQAQKLAEKWNNYANETETNYNTEQQGKLKAEGEALQKKWGAAYDQNTNIAKQAAKSFGVEPETLDILEKQIGFSKVMELMHAVGSKIQPDKFINGDGKTSFGVMTPEAAFARIQALSSDKAWTQRYLSGGLQEKEEMTQLQQWAHPGEQAV